MSGTHQLNDAERVDWLQLSRTERIGPVTFGNLLRRYGTAKKALAELPKLAKAGGGRSFKLYPRSAAEDEITRAERIGAAFVVAGEPGYPPYLKHIADAPPLLCIRGHRDVAARDAVAIVGARNASANGMRFARMLAGEIATAGFVIVSGLARGIDTAAHEASVAKATAAVMAGGIDHIYPPENQKLYGQIAEHGLLVSEMPPGLVPRAEHFPRRNRIISGMARAVIVVEAALRSGSLITARLAADQGRDVFAVPGSPLDPRCEGTNRLIKDGAQILTAIDDVLEALQATARPQIALAQEPPAPISDEVGDKERHRVLTALSPTETAIDDIIRECGLPAEQVAAVLLELEIAGRVIRGRGGRIALSGD